MRIAQIAPLFESVPPRGYGGTERVVSYLTEALVELGHEVTLFATADSVTSADLVAMADGALRTDPQHPDWVAAHTRMVDEVFRRAAEFDVIHFHIDTLQYPLAARSPTPSLTTLHGRLDLPGLPAFHQHFQDHPLVSISDDQRRPLPGARFVATIHHGLPPGLYDFTPQADGYFVFLGRLSPEKRLDRAVEIAVACGTPLCVAAKIDSADAEYVEREIRPLLAHPLVQYLGEVGDAHKDRLLGHARALLFPVDWPEPFGLVMIEALACGTPVIAYDQGSVREVLEDGVTGHVVTDQAGAIEAARRIGRIDRRRCRQEFERRFTAVTMAEAYLRVYQGLQPPRPAAGRPKRAVRDTEVPE